MRIKESDGLIRLELPDLRKVERAKAPDFGSPPKPRDLLRFRCEGMDVELVLPAGGAKLVAKALEGGDGS